MADTTAKVFLEALLKGDEKVRAQIGAIARAEYEVAKEGEKTTKKSAQWFKKLKAGWLAVAAAIGGTVVALVRFGKEAVKAASNFEEANNKFNVVFRGVRREANTMRKELVKDYAMSTTEATNFLSAIQDMLVPMGMGRGAAAALGGEIVKLSADLFSFNPRAQSMDEVMRDIQSALAGQIEPMRKYGVFLTQDRIAVEALNMGLVKQGEALTTAAKAQATMAIIAKDSGDAIGDMARTADGYKNTMKKLRAEFDDMKVAIGQELMKALLPAMRGLKSLIEELGGAAMTVRKVANAFGVAFRSIKLFVEKVTSVLFPVAAITKKAADSSSELATAIQAADGNMRQAAKNGLRILTEKLSFIIVPIRRVIEMIKELADAWKALMEGDFKKAADIAGKAIGDTWEDMVAAMKEKFQSLRDSILGDYDKIREAGAENAEALIEENAGTIEQVKYNEQEFTAWIEGEYKKRTKALEDAQKARTKAVEATNKTIRGEAIKLTETLGQMWLDLNQMKLDAETSAQIASIRQSDMSEKEKANAIAQIKIDQWNAEKKAARAQARMDYAVSIMKAFRQLGPIGGAIATVALTAAWAAQEQMIDQTPKPDFPTYQRGGIAGLHGPELAMVGEAGPELVIPAGPTREMMQGGDTNSISVGSGAIVINVDGGSPGAVRREVEMAMRGIADDVGRGSFFRE